MRFIIFLFVFFLSYQPSVAAVESIVVQAAFGKKKAVLLIDDQRRILSIGQTSPEGVKLISVNSQQATLEINGKQKSYALGTSISTSFSKRKSVEEKVFSNDRGMFLSLGTINGQSVRFLLDTGATTVAMNKLQAKKLGIRYRIDGEAMGVSTASGYVKAYRIVLKSVSLGGIKMKNVEAAVIDGKHPGPILLGMSFLGKLQVETMGNAMTLKQKR